MEARKKFIKYEDAFIRHFVERFLANSKCKTCKLPLEQIAKNFFAAIFDSTKDSFKSFYCFIETLRNENKNIEESFIVSINEILTDCIRKDSENCEQGIKDSIELLNLLTNPIKKTIKEQEKIARGECNIETKMTDVIQEIFDHADKLINITVVIGGKEVKVPVFCFGKTSLIVKSTKKYRKELLSIANFSVNKKVYTMSVEEICVNKKPYLLFENISEKKKGK